MSEETFFGKTITLGFVDREDTVRGVVVATGDEWTLMKNNPLDYMIDGFILINHAYIAGYEREEEEEFVDKILSLKPNTLPDLSSADMTDLSTILQWAVPRARLLHIETDSEESFYLGEIVSVSTSSLILKCLSPMGEWDETETIDFDDIRIIQFDNDYNNSLKLWLEDNKR